jgi:hypothetical protein
MSSLTALPYLGPQISGYPQSFSTIQPSSVPMLEAYQKFSKEKNYKINILCTDQKILVSAWLPESVNIDVNASYDAPFAQGLSGMAPAMIGNLARFMGLSMTTQALTAQVWQGGSFIDFTLQLIFQAEASGAEDVMIPIKKLLKLVMPQDPTGGGLLSAPGPHLDYQKLKDNGLEQIDKTFSAKGIVNGLVDTAVALTDHPVAVISGIQQTAGKIAQPVSRAIEASIVNNISLYVGSFLYFKSVVVTDVSPTFDVMLGEDMNPQKASVNVTFRTFFMPTAKDIEDMFPAAPGDNQEGFVQWMSNHGEG